MSYNLEDVLISLGPDRTTLYGPRPIPNEIDDEVRELVRFLGEAEIDLRDTVFSIMSAHHGYILLAFSDRMAALAVRTGNTEFVRQGMVALAFGSRLVDYRDAFSRVCLLYHSLIKLNAEPVEFFADGAGLGEKWFDTNLRGFLGRSEIERSLDAWRYIESSDEDGFRYKRTW